MNHFFDAPETVEQIIINGYDLTNYSTAESEYEVVTDEPQDGDSFMTDVIYFPAIMNAVGYAIHTEFNREFYSEYDAMYYVAKRLDPDHESHDKDAGEYWQALPHISVRKGEYDRI
jgi:hypothetical protein